MAKQMRTLLTVVTTQDAANNCVAILESIDEKRIVFRTDKPIRVAKDNFEAATVRLIYGNNANIMFFLNEYSGYKIDESNGRRQYLYTFLAPKQKNTPVNHYGIGEFHNECSGYEKLRNMLRPKRVKKVSA